MIIDNKLLDGLLKQAQNNQRLRQHFDLRTSLTDTSQRMLNVLLPGTEVSIHRHRNTTETVVCLKGKMEEIFYEETEIFGSVDNLLPQSMDGLDVVRKHSLHETERILLCPDEGNFGCQIPKGIWHSVRALEPSFIFEAKDGAFAPLCDEDIW